MARRRRLGEHGPTLAILGAVVILTLASLVLGWLVQESSKENATLRAVFELEVMAERVYGTALRLRVMAGDAPVAEGARAPLNTALLRLNDASILVEIEARGVRPGWAALPRVADFTPRAGPPELTGAAIQLRGWVDAVLSAPDLLALAEAEAGLSTLMTETLRPTIAELRGLITARIAWIEQARQWIERFGFAVSVIALVVTSVWVLRPLVGRLGRVRQTLKRTEAALQAAALRDMATDLPNAAAMTAALETALTTHAEAPQDVALALLRIEIDEEHLATVPDLTRADVLTAVAECVAPDPKAAEFVAYLGDGRFAHLATGSRAGEQLANRVTTLQSQLFRGIRVGKATLSLSSNTGIATGYGAVSDPHHMLENVEIALREAAIATVGQPAIYTHAMREQMDEYRAARDDLERALEAGEFTAHFQPQVHIADRRIVGFEALVRWDHPTRGLIGPLEFLSLAEAAGLHEAITICLVDEALAGLAAFRAGGIAVETVGINLSATQLASDTLVDLLFWGVDRHGVEPKSLSLEILESVTTFSANDPVVASVRALARAGFQIDLDDFGTGSASISAIRRFGVDRLKIDQSMLRDITQDDGKVRLLGATIAMARAMDVSVLAEGVETEDELRAVRGLGCETVQGYLLARPMPLEEAVAWGQAFQSRAAAHPALSPSYPA